MIRAPSTGLAGGSAPLIFEFFLLVRVLRSDGHSLRLVVRLGLHGRLLHELLHSDLAVDAGLLRGGVRAGHPQQHGEDGVRAQHGQRRQRRHVGALANVARPAREERENLDG